MGHETDDSRHARARRGRERVRRRSARAGRRTVHRVFLLVLLVAGAWGALSGAVVPELIAMMVP